MRKPERKRAFSPKRDYTIFVTWLTCLGALIFRIPLEHLTGDKGVAYFGVANEICLAVAGTVSYGLSEAVAVLVRYRMKRAQFKNAGRVLGAALMLGGGIGLIFSILFGFFGHSLAAGVFHVPLAGMAVSIMAPAMLFSILTGVLRGYFKGNGSRVPALHSQILYTVVLFLGGLLGAVLLRGYGQKVSALLQNDDYTGAYGAMGASIGILAASVFCFLHALILFFIFKRGLDKQTGREMQKSQDTVFRLLFMLTGTGVIYGLYFFCFHSLPLLDQYLFFRSGADSGNQVIEWGACYGKCLVIIGVICCVINMVCMMPVRRIVMSFESEEPRYAKERLGILIHQCAVISIPAAVYLAVMAENILDLLFEGNHQQAASWLRTGSMIIVFYVLSSVLTELLVRSRRIKYVTGMGIIALLIHTGVIALLLKAAKMGIMAVFIAVIVFYAVVMILAYLLVSRVFQYSQEWIRSFGITLAASLVSGVIAMLLNKVFAPLMGTVMSMVICVPVAIAVYMVLLVVTRAFRDGELEEMAGGRLLLMLARMLHFA